MPKATKPKGNAREAFRNGTITIGIPSAAAVVFSLLLGGLVAVNEAVLNLSTEWHAYVAIILILFAGLGISPLVGESFKTKLFAFLHLPPWVALVIAAGLAAAVLGLSTLHMSDALHAIVAGIVTVFAALGFAPSMPILITGGGARKPSLPK